MDSVVFAGGSSGGFIAADFTTIQTNPQYSKESGIKPVIKSKNIKALVLESPALDASRGHKTKRKFNNRLYLWSKYGCLFRYACCKWK